MSNQMPIETLSEHVGIDISKITHEHMAALAREIAMDINELPIILRNNAISVEQFEIIKVSSFFRKLLESYTQAWTASGNTPERLKLEGAAMLEAFYPTLFKRMTSPTEPLNHVVQAAQFIAKTSGLGEAKDNGTIGDRFSITINLGADTQIVFDKDKAVMPAILDITPEPIVI